MIIKTIFFIANSDGALFNFRESLIRKLVKTEYRVITISGTSVEGCYRSKLKNLGVYKHIELNFSGSKISILSFIFLIFKVSKLCHKFNPDIVHCFTHKGCISGALGVIFSLSKARLVFTITGLGRVFTSNGFLRPLLRKFILFQYLLVSFRAHKVFFQNTDDANLFEKKCLLNKRQILVVGGSGVDLKKINPENEYDLDEKDSYFNNLIKFKDKKIVVLMLGRGMIEKGFFEYYQAAKFISELFPQKYIFVHAGSIDENVLGEINANDIDLFAKSHSVNYLGFRNDSEALLSYSDIVIHASYYREGVPRSLIEALAMDKTIITCDTIGNREVLVNEWNGFFCLPRNTQSLISCILRADDDFRSMATGNSLLLASKKFDVEVIDESVLRAYFD